MEEKSKKTSAIEIIIWMVLTAIVVYILTSWRFTKLYFEEANNIDYYASSGDYSFTKLKKVYKILQDDYLFDYDVSTIEDGAIRGMLEALDEPYTNYFDKDETESFLTQTEGEYEGIGVYIAIDTYRNLAVVLTPIKGSPALEAGVKPGDYILEIDGEDVKEKTLEEIAAKIKGKKATSVNIKFARYNESGDVETFEKEIERRKIEVNFFEHKVLEEDIGYIVFDSFDERVVDQFKNAYKELIENKKVKGLIIDLRDNGGGLLEASKEISDMLVPTGIITYTVDKNGEKETLYSDSTSCPVPIVVLVNGNTASASEIMAGAIKGNGVGKIVGTTTYGKGLVQEFKSLKDGTYVKVTISEYFSPDGNKINKIGIEPNYIVEDNEETDEDEQLQKALEVMKEMM